MDEGIASRALYHAGQDPLAQGDMGSAKRGMLKSFYLATFLEALSEVAWTGGRRRSRLAVTGRPVARGGKYRHAYDLPFDCARPIELQGNAFFEVEGRLLLTDQERAELLYVSNGKALRPVGGVHLEAGGVEDMEYLGAQAEPDAVLADSVELLGQGEYPPDPQPEEDYPDYRPPEYEPKFYEYVEKMLAAKLSLKLSDQPGLHREILAEAMLAKQEAIDASLGSHAAEMGPGKWWGKEIGA